MPTARPYDTGNANGITSVGGDKQIVFKMTQRLGRPAGNGNRLLGGSLVEPALNSRQPPVATAPDDEGEHILLRRDGESESNVALRRLVRLVVADVDHVGQNARRSESAHERYLVHGTP